MSDTENVLIYRLGSLGDTIIALPAFHLVREAFPHARITLLTNHPVAAKAAPAAAVLGEGYFFDDLMAYPVGLREPGQILGLIRQIRRKNIHTVVNLASFRSVAATWRDQAFFWCSGVRRMIGFSIRLEDRQPVLNPANGLVEWEASRLARRVAALGKVDLHGDRWWDLRIDDQESAAAGTLVAPVKRAASRIALSVGTKVHAKDWGLQNWTELAKRLNVMLPGYGLILVGAGDEHEASEACLREWSGPAVNLCGRSSPRVSAAVLKQCNLFVGHDSGPMHLAACVGVPCVAVFSARNFEGQWIPRGRRNQIIYHRTDCAGCRLQVCVEQKKKCMTSITVDEVEAAVRRVLSEATTSIISQS